MKEDSYNPADIEKKAQAYWEKNKSFEVKVIVGASAMLDKFGDVYKRIKADGINIDYNVDPKKILNEIKIPIQGGLDPKILLTDQKTLKIEVEKYLGIFKNHPYIFNLGHGILPETKIEMVEELIKIVRNFK